MDIDNFFMDKLILLTNDDGINSLGIKSLYNSLKNRFDVVCVAPESPSSAVSKALTFHKPLRYQKVLCEDENLGYSTTGSPADNILLGFHLLKRKPDLVVSGINYGDNTSIHSILTSGTCAAAFEAAFNGVPAVAFSAAVADDAQLIDQKGIDFEPMAEIAAAIVEYILKNKWPSNLAFINVNFPTAIHGNEDVYITKPVLYKYDNYMVEKLDPRGLPYLWLWGKRKEQFPEGSDAWAVLEKKGISITPIAFEMYDKTKESEALLATLKQHLSDLHV